MEREFILPRGFKLSGIHAGIKQASTQNDLALFVADTDSVASGTYTTNFVRSSAVLWNESRTPMTNCRAIIVNSGNANACTGKRGEDDTREMARLAAEAVGASPDQILVMSTGIIGHFLEMEKVTAGVKSAASSLTDDNQAIHHAAQAIMTTDLREKIAARTFQQNGNDFQLIGFAKGAGMIGPNMATMLSVILTDAPLTAGQSAASLSAAVNASFNCVSVDGHMSTSDTCLMISSGNPQGESSLDTDGFTNTLTELCVSLAKQIADDGEGATHLITIDVSGCNSANDAQLIAKTIANSALVKTAIAGNDPNWGRIVSAAGYAGVPFQPAGCSLSINGTQVFSAGMPTNFDAARLSAEIKANRETLIEISFSEGDQRCQFWTCDLTAEYVHINADYHT